MQYYPLHWHHYDHVDRSGGVVEEGAWVPQLIKIQVFHCLSLNIWSLLVFHCLFFPLHFPFKSLGKSNTILNLCKAKLRSVKCCLSKSLHGKILPTTETYLILFFADYASLKITLQRFCCNGPNYIRHICIIYFPWTA